MRKTPQDERYPTETDMGSHNADGIDRVAWEPGAGTSRQVELVGKSRAFRRVINLVEKFKESAAPVFIGGESGTGKEVVACAIHFGGSRKQGRFVAVNCAAIPEPLIESELFGYTRGAFTGAARDKPGLVEEASFGTLFLDEIGDLSPHLQAKLLRLIEAREIRRVGENRCRPVDVRFISATNKDIDQEVAEGRFREDLFYRLKILPIELEPLRHRKDDILPLVEYFLDKFCREMNRSRASVTPAALDLMHEYTWPGNVRELQSELQRCLIFCNDTELITERDISPKINPHRAVEANSAYDYFKAKAEFEKRFLRQALNRFNYNRARTAQEIGLSRQGLFKLIKKHRIEVPETPPASAAKSTF
jgi:transcriptional regulator with PAS, ATPase and Fis domain